MGPRSDLEKVKFKRQIPIHNQIKVVFFFGMIDFYSRFISQLTHNQLHLNKLSSENKENNTRSIYWTIKHRDDNFHLYQN